jgi:spermidine synthase
VLSYQVLWQRVLTQMIGSDAVSIGLVVTIFMILNCVGKRSAAVLGLA